MFAKEFDESRPFGGQKRRGRTARFDLESMQSHHGGFRAGRGMMEPAILMALSDKPMHGYEIITWLEETSHGMWRPSPGSVYPTLQLLEEKGQVKIESDNDKKIYTLTEDGEQAAKEGGALREQFRRGFHHKSQGVRDQRRILGEIMRSMREIHHKGTIEQKTQLEEAIIAFKTRLEQIQQGDE